MTEQNKGFGSVILHYSKKYLTGIGLAILEFLKVAILAGVTICLIRYFLFKPFYVKGASMEINYFDHEYLIIDELSYRFHEPVRGDVVVFRYPNNPSEYFLKRVIGLSGERVKVSEGKVTVYNDQFPEGVILNETYLSKDILTDGEKIVSLGYGQYFLMGDNRPNSFDSRRFGPVDKELIVGRTWFRGWPFSRAQFFSSPTYNYSNSSTTSVPIIK